MKNKKDAKEFRWRITTSIAVVIILIFTIWQVPFLPHKPICTSYPRENQTIPRGVDRSFWFNGYAMDGSLSAAYIDSFTEHLNAWNIPYVRLGGTVFLRLQDRISDPGSLIFNADQKTIRYLANPDWNPAWKTMPGDIRERLIELKNGRSGDFCEFHRILVLKNWGRD